MYFKCCSLTSCCTIYIVSFRLRRHINKRRGLCIEKVKRLMSLCPRCEHIWFDLSGRTMPVWFGNWGRSGWWFGSWSDNPIGSDERCWWWVDLEDHEVGMFHTIGHMSKVVVGSALVNKFWYTLNISGMTVFFKHMRNSTLRHKNWAWISTILMYINLIFTDGVLIAKLWFFYSQNQTILVKMTMMTLVFMIVSIMTIVVMLLMMIVVMPYFPNHAVWSLLSSQSASVAFLTDYTIPTQELAPKAFARIFHLKDLCVFKGP